MFEHVIVIRQAAGNLEQITCLGCGKYLGTAGSFLGAVTLENAHLKTCKAQKEKGKAAVSKVSKVAV